MVLHSQPSRSWTKCEREPERCCPQQGQRQQELLRSRLQFEQGLVALCRVRSEFLLVRWVQEPMRGRQLQGGKHMQIADAGEK